MDTYFKRQDGSVWQSDNWMGRNGGGRILPTRAACKWYADRLGEIIDMGVDCIKTDFGERIPTDVIYFDTVLTPEECTTDYPYLYNKTIFGMPGRKRGKGEAIVFVAVFQELGTLGISGQIGRDDGLRGYPHFHGGKPARRPRPSASPASGYWAHEHQAGLASGTATPDSL